MQWVVFLFSTQESVSGSVLKQETKARGSRFSRHSPLCPLTCPARGHLFVFFFCFVKQQMY